MLLLNDAPMQPEPITRIVFGVSAAASLCQDETWTPDLRGLPKELGGTIGNACG
jgi:hypothetical protein